jgi:hypothetical protein
MTTAIYTAKKLPNKVYGITRFGIFNTAKEAFVARNNGRTVTFEGKSGATRYASLYNDGLMVE